MDAEVSGWRGENVVLTVQGVSAQWPAARLAPPDQAYVREWKTSHAGVKKIAVQVAEKDGVGRTGEFPAAQAAPAAPPLPGNLPIGPKTTTKTAYKHCEVSLHNPAATDAGFLKVEYVLYVVAPDGRVGSSAAAQAVKVLGAGQGVTLVTEAVTESRTKTTSLKLSVNDSKLFTSESTSRTREQFGGAWVRVSGPDGTLVVEAKKLSPALEKLNPPWVESAPQEGLPVLASLGGFKELLKKLLPPAPAGQPAAPPALPGPPGKP